MYNIQVWIYCLKKKNGLNYCTCTHTHLTPTLTSHNATPWFNTVFSADQYMFIWNFTYPPRQHQASSITVGVWGLFLHPALHEYWFTQFSLASWSVSKSLWTTAILHGSKWPRDIQTWHYISDNACRNISEWVIGRGKLWVGDVL